MQPRAVEGSLITIKEEFLASTKTRLAVKLGGWEAIALWLALRGYVSSGNTGGFVPSESIDDLPGIPRNWGKAMKGLLECGKLRPDGSRGPGLVVKIEHGVMFHDYDDHGTPPEAEELRRQKAREQKRKRREELAKLSADKAGQNHRTTAGHQPADVAGQATDTAPDSPPDSPAPAGVRPSAPRTSGHVGNPSPAQPSPEAAAAGRVPCPRDLTLTADQRGSLETSLVPGWAIDAITSKFVAKSTADPDDKRDIVHWRKCLAIAVAGDWNDHSKRPKQPRVGDLAAEENGGYGDASGFT